MGSRVVRSHTLGETNFCFWESHKNVGGISTGTGEFHAYGMASVPCTRGGDKPDKGTFSLINAFLNIFQSLENFESIDYAVYKVRQLGLKLIAVHNWLILLKLVRLTKLGIKTCSKNKGDRGDRMEQVWDWGVPGGSREAVREDGLLAGSLFWSMFGHAETFGKFKLSGSGPSPVY